MEWTPVSFDNGNVTGYQVSTSTTTGGVSGNPGTSLEIMVNNASVGEYTFTGLVPYQYGADEDGVEWMTQVRVMNAFGVGPNSNAVTIFVPRESRVC